MNEQQLADLFSQQIDRMLDGQPVDASLKVDDLSDLLTLGRQISQARFQPTAAAQAAFQSQLGHWFGLTNGGSSMTIFGISKIWFISILVVTAVVFGGGGMLIGSITNITVVGATGRPVAGMIPTSTTEATQTTEPATSPTNTAMATDAPTNTPTATDIATDTPVLTTTGTVYPTEMAMDTPTTTPYPTATLVSTATIVPTATVTPLPTTTPYPTPTVSPTPQSTTQPTDPPSTGQLPSLIFVNHLVIPQLCGGVYTTQNILANYGGTPIQDAALVWDVIEGAEYVNTVTVNSNSFVHLETGNQVTTVDTTINTSVQVSTSATEVNTAVAITNTTAISQSNYGNLNQISIDQNVALDVAVKVNDAWWTQPDGTKIKVALSVQNQHISDEDDGDDNRGHGNDADGVDEDNPGWRHRRPVHIDPSRRHIITLVKQGTKWVKLKGLAHYYGDQTLLLDGNIVGFTNCTSLPPVIPPGSNVEVIGILQPNGTFIAINVTVINVNIFVNNFGSNPFYDDEGSSNNDNGDSGCKASKKSKCKKPQSNKCKGSKCKK